MAQSLRSLGDTSDLTLYDPESGLKSIAVAEAGEKYFARAKDLAALSEAVRNKLTQQREYILWRDGVVIPALGQGRPKKAQPRTSLLPSSDPGYRVAHIWRRMLKKIETFEKTLADDLEKCRQICEADRREKRERNVPDGPLPEIASDRCELLCGDFREVEIPPESVDCVVTDPPYPEKFIELYFELAQHACRWLKPGGSLLAMAGQSHLPRVLNALISSELSYQWTFAHLTPGGQSVQIFPRRVNTFWKPVFWFVKGTYTKKWVGDVTRSDINDNDKRFHDWGQSESGMADLIQRISERGDVICDPFMGGGTTGVAALSLNRHFIGIERDRKTFRIAQHRLSQTENI